MSMSSMSYLTAYGAYAEVSAFMLTIQYMRSAQILSSGIDPETGMEVGALGYIFAVSDFLPAGRLITQPLKKGAKKALRRQARNLWDQRSKIPRSDGSDIHHIIPLEYSHLFYDLNPNRLSNLALFEGGVHRQINALWNKFRAANPDPTPEQVLEQVTQIGKMFGSKAETLN